jgi:cullin-associated NEDD8-dissociated protein 1
MDAFVSLATRQLSFDPNLADGSDNNDENDAMALDSDGDELDMSDYEGDFSDDEDLSWKVRRAAAALIVSLVKAYADQVAKLYGVLRPVLVRRFKEREESVKLDIFAAYSALVRAGAEAGCLGGGDAAADAALLVRHLRTRSVALKTGVFCVVRTLVSSTPSFFGGAAVPAAEAVLRDDTSSNALKVEVLRFLTSVMVPAAAAELAPLLGGLARGLETALADKYFKVVAETLLVVERAAEMVASARSEEGARVVVNLLGGVLNRLRGGDQDQEVKANAIRCALLHAGPWKCCLSWGGCLHWVRKQAHLCSLRHRHSILHSAVIHGKNMLQPH